MLSFAYFLSDTHVVWWTPASWSPLILCLSTRCICLLVLLCVSLAFLRLPSSVVARVFNVLQSQLFSPAPGMSVCSVWLQVFSVFLFLLQASKGVGVCWWMKNRCTFQNRLFSFPTCELSPSPFCLPWLKGNVWGSWSLTQPGQTVCTVPFTCLKKSRFLREVSVFTEILTHLSPGENKALHQLRRESPSGFGSTVTVCLLPFI